MGRHTKYLTMDFKSMNDISDSKYGKFACYDVLRLATVRGAELAAFESSVDVLTASALTGLQRLPVRLRRRAASHRVNRLPRRFHRHYHLSTSNNNGSQSESSVCKQKLKSRRYRRRKLRLLALHSRFMTNRCQNSSQNLKPAWLPTHIWHAKRFHMITKWGWRLPYSPTNKIFKACHKASHNGCLLFDFSYLNCFQVYGPEAMISNCLNCIFQLDCQVESLLPELTELKTPVQSCEQTGILYTTTKCVQHISRPVLGPVRILWGSRNSPKDNFRHIWLWLHPCISESAWRLLQSYIKETHLNNKTEDILHLSDLTGYFCRLHTIGRQSHGLISDILKVRDENDIKDDNWTFWNHLSTSIREAVCIPSGLVINLSNCEDFRSNRPRLKIRNQNWCVTPIKLSDNRSQQQQVTCASSTNESHFVLPSGKQLSWSDIKKSYPNIYPSPDELLSTELNRDSEESKTDIILIQNSTPSLVRLSPESIGWDIILRRNFPQSKNEQALLRGSLAARDFLIACVYRGSEVGGLRDLYHWAGLGTRGGGHFYSFPDTLWPDTPAGQESAQSVTEEKLNRLKDCHKPLFNTNTLMRDFVHVCQLEFDKDEYNQAS
ncbi:unnamed protein product [Heterobilharzia americana]|nr:unnamed protein product [Heterobilharzia americana]